MATVPQKLTILVVEDDALVRLHGIGVLEDAGFDVLNAANADEAITLLKEHGHVSLMFSDINMPGTMDGIELAQFVHGHWPHVRLLLTSANHQPGLDTTLKAGCFMGKPWGQEALIRRVRDMLAA